MLDGEMVSCELYEENKSCDYKEISSPTREPAKNLRTKSTGFLFHHYSATGHGYLYDTEKTQKCSVVLSSCVINYLFTQNLFPRFPPYFIKFNVERGLKITH